MAAVYNIFRKPYYKFQSLFQSFCHSKTRPLHLILLFPLLTLLLPAIGFVLSIALTIITWTLFIGAVVGCFVGVPLVMIMTFVTGILRWCGYEVNYDDLLNKVLKLVTKPKPTVVTELRKTDSVEPEETEVNLETEQTKNEVAKEEKEEYETVISELKFKLKSAKLDKPPNDLQILTPPPSVSPSAAVSPTTIVAPQIRRDSGIDAENNITKSKKKKTKRQKGI
ncbi:hypothetical protein BKA69DRAFT_1039728 [Paraphysoderma sedebokerense]|nr:hypothetical protein BKA69DRAFT_1039728 [Paraphysoderma sedebokerense]